MFTLPECNFRESQRRFFIMKKRTPGQKLEVSAIGFGCMGLNFGYANPVTKEDGIKLIRAAVEPNR